jgi:hypothetical protein
MVHFLKEFFDAEFIRGGKVPVMAPGSDLKNPKIVYTTFTDSYSANEITDMITHYLAAPSDRFMLVKTPPDVDGNRYNFMYTGRFGKENTTITRAATLTDVMYMVAAQVVKDKHVFVVRYPLDNYNGQFPARIVVASTIKTEIATIGNEVYPFFPVCEGDPANAFVDTLQMSNTMIGPMGADLTVSRRGRCGSNAVRITRRTPNKRCVQFQPAC